MDIKAIKTEEDYNQTLKRLEKIFHAPKDHPGIRTKAAPCTA